MKKRSLGVAVAGASLLAAGIAACSTQVTNPGAAGVPAVGREADAGTFLRDGSVYDSAPPPASGLGILLLRPDKLYTGRDGTHAFSVPVAVYDADADLTVTADDPSVVTLTKTALKNPVGVDGVVDSGIYFLVSAKKAGTYTLTATSRGVRTTASLTVSDYDSDSYAAGEARYANNKTSKTKDRACTTCHVQGAGIDHSPAALASVSDQDVGVIIASGVKAGAAGPQVITIASEPGTLHKWNVTDSEKDGLVTYLRALAPRGFQ